MPPNAKDDGVSWQPAGDASGKENPPGWTARRMTPGSVAESRGLAAA
jgi:hypothetical protein